MFQLSAGPYARPTDNTLSVLSGVAYCFLLLGALTLKLSSIAEELGDQLSDQLQGIFSVSTGPVLLVLFCSILISTVFSIAVTLREAVIDLRQPKLRFTASNGLVHLPLQPGKTHHLFVSHVWGSAQDQARVLRGRLQAIVPGLQVWLDVEDLVDISKLEEAVDAMQTVLVIVSSGCECSAIRTTQMEVLTNSHSDTEPLYSLRPEQTSHLRIVCVSSCIPYGRENHSLQWRSATRRIMVGSARSRHAGSALPVVTSLLGGTSLG